MSQLDTFAEVGNGREDNIQFTIGAGESVTCYFQASGSDTATAKYYDLRAAAMKCNILVSAAATVTHINGHELKNPILLGAGRNNWTKGIRWEKITVRADSSTTFNVYAY